MSVYQIGSAVADHRCLMIPCFPLHHGLIIFHYFKSDEFRSELQWT